jgi:hypothetical protein
MLCEMNFVDETLQKQIKASLVQGIYVLVHGVHANIVLSPPFFLVQWYMDLSYFTKYRGSSFAVL